MDRRTFIGGLAAANLVASSAALGASLKGAPKRAPARAAKALSTLAPNTARDIGAYANPDFEFGANITDYSGIVYDPVGRRMCMFGGGHGPSQETDIRALDLATQTWSSLYPPTPVAEITFANCDVGQGRYITTNQPTARHSYNLMVVRGNRLYLLCYFGMPDHLDGVLGSTSGWGGRICWYDFGSGKWTYSRQSQAATPWYYASAAALDPVSGNIVVAGPTAGGSDGGLWLYDPVADAIGNGPQIAFGYSAKLVYFPPNDRFYVVQSDGRVWEITLDRGRFAASSAVPVSVGGTRPAAGLGIVCGYAYDAVNRVIGGNVQNGMFYAFDPATSQWTATRMLVEQGSSGVPNQVFHCLDYDPVSGVYVFLDTPNYGSPGSPTTWVYRNGQPAPKSAGVVDDLTVSLDFGGGNVAVFAGTDAVDMGDFVGEYVRQKSFLVTHPAYPDWRVWLRVDADAGGSRIAEPAAGWRDEAIVEYGRSGQGVPAHLRQPYVANVTKSGVQKASYAVPRHWWYGRWRYQSSPRPIVRTPQALRERGWIPNFGTEGMFGGGAGTLSVAWPGPMQAPQRPPPSYPFNPAMASGGDNDQIGFLTEAGAGYMIFGGDADLATLRTEGEWCGNWCIHIRDDATAGMPDARNLAASFRSAGGSVNDAPSADTASEPAFVDVEDAHWYPCANAPWLLTDDPYFLEELQFGMNWRILWDRGPRLAQQLGGLVYPGQTRSTAWGLRDLFYLTASCPTAVPPWLRPRSYWKACVDDNLTFAMKFVQSPARVHKLFRTWTRVDMDRSWMSAWLNAVCGIAVDQGFPEWSPVFKWAIDKQIQQTSGKSGWSRQWPAPYGSTPVKTPGYYATFDFYPHADTTLDAATCASWAEYWQWYASGTGGHSDDTGHVIDTTGWDGHTLMAQFYPAAGYAGYFLHVRAALAVAVTRGIPGAQACYDYLHGELVTVMPQHYRVTGQARFSIDPKQLAANYEGLWWSDPPGSEPGWGISLEHEGDVIFLIWLAYDAAGNPAWLSMTATSQGVNTFGGTLYRTTGPGFSAPTFDPALVSAAAVGSATLTFGDAQSGVFAYEVNGVSGEKPITRQVFATDLPDCRFGEDDPSLATNYQGAWWAAPAGSESGWGLGIAHQDNVIFATWFAYGDDGAPVWLSFSANRAPDGTYAGTVVETTGPPFGAGSFDPSRVVVQRAGTATLAFTDGSTGTFSYTLHDVTRAKAITRLVFRAPGTMCQ